MGVEAGQLAIVALVFWPLAWWVRRPWYPTLGGRRLDLDPARCLLVGG